MRTHPSGGTRVCLYIIFNIMAFGNNPLLFWPKQAYFLVKNSAKDWYSVQPKAVQLAFEHRAAPSAARPPAPRFRVARSSDMARSRSRKRKAMPSAAAVASKKRQRGMAVPKAGLGYLRTSGYFGGQELRFHVKVVNATTSAVTTVTFDDMLLIPQDGTESGRIGQTVKIAALSMNVQLGLAAALSGTIGDADGHTGFRVVLVQDKQANGATASFTDVFESSGLQTYRNRENLKRFKVLYDRVINVNSAGMALVNAAGDGIDYYQPQKEVPFKVVFPMRGMEIDFDSSATTGATATRRSNNLVAFIYIAHSSISTYYVEFETLWVG